MNYGSEKNKILTELFKDISNNECVLDLLLNNSKYGAYQVSEESKKFVSECVSKLKSNNISSKILFFRKYEYEKILNEYLSVKYKSGSVKISIFEEQEKLDRERKEKQRKKEEQYIIEHIKDFKWSKKIEKKRTTYMSLYNGKEILFEQLVHHKKTNLSPKYKLTYDLVQFSMSFNGDDIIKNIKDANPSFASNKIVFNAQNMQQNKIKNIKKKEQECNKPDKTSNKDKKKSSKKDLSLINSKINTTPIKIQDSKIQNYLEKTAKYYGLNINELKKIVKSIENNCECRHGTSCYVISNTNKYKLYQCSIACPNCIKKGSLIEEIKKENDRRTRIEKERFKTKYINNGLFDEVEDIYISKKNNEHTVRDEDVVKIGIKDFVVRGNVFKCAHNKHKIEDITATINIDVDCDVENIKISAGYCPQCKIFFILDSTYQKLKRKGIVLCRISDQKNYAVGSSYGEMNLAKESLLMQYGYNVSQTEGLSETRRQKILALIIDNKAMSKSEIISYLDFFIMQREGMSNMQIAVSKWWDDRAFVEEYKVGEYTQYGVKAIYRTKVGMPKKQHSRYRII